MGFFVRQKGTKEVCDTFNMFYQPSRNVLPPRPVRKHSHAEKHSSEIVDLAQESYKHHPRANNGFLKSCSLDSWQSPPKRKSSSRRSLTKEEVDETRSLSENLDTSFTHVPNYCFTEPKSCEPKKHHRLTATRSFGYLFRRQLSLPNYTSSSSKLPSPVSVSAVKKSKSHENVVGKLESPKSRRQDILHRRWDSTTALDKRSLMKEKLGHALFYGSDSDLMKSGVLYADENKVYVHDRCDGLSTAEEISLDDLMSESLSELETIKESPELHFYDRDSNNIMNNSESSTLTDIWSDDLEFTLSRAIPDFQQHQMEPRDKRRPVLTRDPWSRHSLDGLLDKRTLLEEAEWYNNDDEEEEEDFCREYETEERMRETDVWIKEFLNEIADPGMPQEPEFYDLGDFNPTPLPQETEPKIYSNGFHKHLCERTYSKTKKCSSGREFVRAQTVSNIPIEKYMTKEEIQQEYDSNVQAPDLPPRGRSKDRIKGSQWLEDDNISSTHCYQRGASCDSKGYRRNKHHRKKGSAWTVDDGDMSSPSSPVAARKSQQGTAQLYYVTPPQSQMAGPVGSESRLDRGTRGGSITRLARRLSQRDKKDAICEPDPRKKTLRQRSVSLDCGDNRRPLVTMGGDHPELIIGGRGDHLSIPTSPSVPSKLGHRYSDRRSSSPNLSRRTSSSKNQKSSQASERKKRTQDTQALFEAVEKQDMDEARSILENCVVDVNATNSEQLTPLDIAVFMNHVPMARMLLSYGARENPMFLRCNESRAVKLLSLVKDAEKRIVDLKSLVIHYNAVSAATSTSQYKECERHLNMWEYKFKLYKRMKAGYEHAKPPDPPSNLILSVSSSTSILLQYSEPVHHNGAVVTRYRVEWSCYEDFNPSSGEQILEDTTIMKFEISDLIKGNCYFVKIQAWNMKGWSDWAVPSPAMVTPTSWRDVDGYKCRTDGKFQLLKNLFVNMKNSRPSDAAHIKDQNDASPMPARKSNVRKSIKNLFSTAPKFQRSLKRGVYLASVICCEEKILVTNDDLLPILEVDENFNTTTLNADFHWLMKIACSWEDVKTLRQDMEKNSTHNAFLFRSKLLQAAAQLQSALGIQDLGMFYHTPVKDINGSIVLVTVNSIKDLKSVSTTHVRWASLPKLLKRLATADSIAAPEMLLTSAQDMLLYEKASMTTLPKGLYMGYLKLTSSVDLIRIMVPEKLPNVLPHCKVRENCHVTKEEWDWVRCLSLSEINSEASNTQVCFQNDLRQACQKLLADIGVSEDESVSHRIYDLEVIELSEDVSFILVLPPSDSVCNVPGNQEHLSQRPGYITLPVKLFEMVHMCTYQYELISRYCRLSSILEIDTYLAQQAQREAFSSEELFDAKQRVDQLNCFQQKLDDAWKGMRWTMDIITYARDKSVRGGLPLGILYAPPPSPNESPNMERKSDVSSSVCSDPGYHSDWSSLEQIGGESSSSSQHCTESSSSGGDHKDHSCSCNCNSNEEVWTPQIEHPPGILRIYAAYDTGLSRGTSVKLHVTAKTTSREVVNLVVQQLNKAVLSKGFSGPIYSDEDLLSFCLVVVVGARERVLRDDFQPLLLQNPWTKGKLYVRLKANLLAALEQGQVTSV